MAEDTRVFGSGDKFLSVHQGWWAIPLSRSGRGWPSGLPEGRERATLNGMIRYVPHRQRQFAKHLRSNQTSLEEAVWREVRAKRLDGWKFKRQAPLGPYIVDFVCLEARLIVEVDGPLHEEVEQRNHDAVRDAYLRTAGLKVARFGGDLVLADLAHVVAEIRKALVSPSPDP